MTLDTADAKDMKLEDWIQLVLNGTPGKYVEDFRFQSDKLKSRYLEGMKERPVGAEIARQLLGVVSDEKVNKGVLVTTARFTKGAHDLS